MSTCKWPEGARCAVFLSVNFDAESVDLRDSTGAGLYGRFSYGRYGVRAGFPRLLAVLDRLAISATFFVPGGDAKRHPDLVRSLVDHGHEVAARGVNLEDLKALGDAEVQTLQRSRDILADICHTTPVGFRAPNNSLSIHTLGHLAALGFEYDASFQDDDYPYRIDVGGRTIVELPGSSGLDDAPAYGSRHTHKRLMQTWRDEFDAMYDEGTLAAITMHLRGDLGSTRAARIEALEELLRYMTSRPGVRFMNGRTLAAHVRGLGLPAEPDPALAHLPTLRQTSHRKGIARP